MAKLSDPRGFRKTVAGVCMIAAPAVIVVAVIHPREHSDEAKWLAEVSANTGRQYWAHLLGLLALALAIPAILGVMHMLKARGRRSVTSVRGSRSSESSRSPPSSARSSSSGRRRRRLERTRRR